MKCYQICPQFTVKDLCQCDVIFVKLHVLVIVILKLWREIL